MAAKNKSNEINITRIYDAPVEAVWDAWTDPEQVGPVVGTARLYAHDAQQRFAARRPLGLHDARAGRHRLPK